jgi:hypothetical protein
VYSATAVSRKPGTAPTCERLVAGQVGDAGDQEPRYGHRQHRGQRALRERAGRHERGEDREDDKEDTQRVGSPDRVHVEDQRIHQPGGGEAHHQRGGDTVPGAEREDPDDDLHYERGEHDRATARPSAAGSRPHCSALTSTEPIATVKNPSGIGDPISCRTIRVMERRSGSRRAGSNTVRGSTPAAGPGAAAESFMGTTLS